MLFLVLGYDRAQGGTEIRARTRIAHLEFVAAHRAAFRFGGALLGEGGRMIGTVALIEAPDRAALDCFLAGDPYNRAGLFGSVIICQANQALPEIAQGALLAELERAKAQQQNVA